MQITLSVLALITAGQGGYRLFGYVTDLADEIADNKDGMGSKIKAVSGHAGAASLSAVQFMTGASLLIFAWV